MRTRSFVFAAAALLAGTTASAGLLSAQGAAALDSTGAVRLTFSNNEKIGLSQVVNNGAASVNRITFQFEIITPSNNIAFRHVGNAVPGTVGNAASKVTGIPITSFYAGPGNYTLRAQATLDAVTLEQTASFTISSPNLLLIYPPNGATDLSDNPLVFQWFSSGATTYRVTVADNLSLYNAVYVETTATPSITYPQNPSDPRQRLASGQLYYWNVEGLDINGNVIAQSQVPFSFSLRTATLTRDLAVTDVAITGATGADSNIPFRITVKNQGSTTETGVQLSFTVGGLAAAGAPLAMPVLNPGDEKTFDLPAPIPTDQNSSLAIACLQLFDDSVANNCKTLSVTRPSASPGAGSSGDALLSAEQIWAAIRELLREMGIDLDDYDLTGMEGSLSREELLALLEQLRAGSAHAIISGPPIIGGPVVPVAPAYAPPKLQADAPPEILPEEENAQEWRGMTDVGMKKGRTFTVGSLSVWRKLWPRFSDQKLPDIDFDKNSVVGVVAGKEELVDEIAVDSVEISAGVLRVRYRYVARRSFTELDAPREPKRTTVPFILKIVPRNAKINFEMTKEYKDE